MTTIQENAKTKKLIANHLEHYPLLQLQDLFKFLYQSVFGCEHMLTSLDHAIHGIEKEASSLSVGEDPVTEELDGDYCRIPLSYLNKGLSPKTLGQLFFLSAGEPKGEVSDLLTRLETVKEMILEEILPFSMRAFEEAFAKWEAEGFPALHHSAIFRDTYKPAYRVIAKKYLPLLPFLSLLDKKLAGVTDAVGNKKILVALEGGSASGKTTLSHLLESIYDCTLFSMDDFFLQQEQRTPMRLSEVGGNLDRERFLSEVLVPLNQNKRVHYHKFHCSTMTLSEEITVTPKHLIIIEGVYSMHPLFTDFYDLSVFLDISPVLQKERIQKRNTPKMQERFFNDWIPMENIYFAKTNAKKRCDFVIPVLT